MNLVSLAWKNSVNRPLNLVMSIILFGLGVGLITFLLLVNQQLKDKFDRNLAEIDLVVGAKGSPLQLILCSMYHIDNPTGNVPIEKARPLLREGHPLIKTAIPLSLGDNYKSFRIVGTNHKILELYNASLKDGSLWTRDFDVVIGQAVAKETGLALGSKFHSSHGFADDEDLAHDHASFHVTGILEESGTVLDQLILTNTASIWLVHDHQEGQGADAGQSQDSITHDHASHEGETHAHDNSNADLLNHPDKEITSILVQYKSRTNFQALNFGRNINENTDLQAASPAIEINRLYSMLGVGTEALQSLALLIAFVSALSIFLSLLKSMRERKYELALIRVMGAGRSALFALIVLEGLFLALMGWGVGTLLSHIGMEWMSAFLKEDFRYSFTGWIWLGEEKWIFLFSLLLGVVAALIPAVQAARTDIHTTLSEK